MRYLLLKFLGDLPDFTIGFIQGAMFIFCCFVAFFSDYWLPAARKYAREVIARLLK